MNMELWSGVGITLITFLVGWGFNKAQMAEHDRRINHSEKESAKQLEMIHGLHDVYVSYKHFNEIMSTVREAQKELREDVKKILGLLSSR